MSTTTTDPFPWVCVDGDHRYSIALSSKDAKAGGLLWDPRSEHERENRRPEDG